MQDFRVSSNKSVDISDCRSIPNAMDSGIYNLSIFHTLRGMVKVHLYETFLLNIRVEELYHSCCREQKENNNNFFLRLKVMESSRASISECIECHGALKPHDFSDESLFICCNCKYAIR